MFHSTSGLSLAPSCPLSPEIFPELWIKGVVVIKVSTIELISGSIGLLCEEISHMNQFFYIC